MKFHSVFTHVDAVKIRKQKLFPMFVLLSNFFLHLQQIEQLSDCLSTGLE